MHGHMLIILSFQLVGPLEPLSHFRGGPGGCLHQRGEQLARRHTAAD